MFLISGISYSSRLVVAIAVGLICLIVCVMPVHAAHDDPPRHDIVLLLDDSRSMATYDPAAKRAGFARFLARYQQVFGNPQDTLAVARFAASSAVIPTGVTPLVPLTPPRHWARADFLRVQPLACALPGPNVDIAPCFGTRYAAALAWATEQLQACAQDSAPNKCDILIFTDGEMGKKNSPNPDELAADAPEDVEKALRSLRQKIPSLNIHVIFFSVSDATAPANAQDWQRWRQEKLIQNIFFNASQQSAQQVYEAALTFLGLKDNLKQVNVLEDLTREKIQIKESIQLIDHLPPNIAQLTLDLLSDGEIVEKYAVAPDITTETRRWWLAPTFAVLTTTLSGHGLVYYRVISQTIPAQAVITVAPPEPKPGQPTEVRAVIGVGGRALTSAHGISITAAIEPGNFKAISLVPAPGDLWIAPLPALPPGDYMLHVEARANGIPLGGTAEVGRAEFRVRKPRATVSLRVAPVAQIAGQPFEFAAIPFFDEERVALPDAAFITISLNSGAPLTLTRASDRPWLWQTSWAVETPGSYQAVAKVQAPGWEDIASAPVGLRIYGKPEISVAAGADEVAPGSDVVVTLQMPAGEISPPTLLRHTPNGWERVEGMTTLDNSRYEKRVTMPGSGALVLLAAPPAEAPGLPRPMQTVAMVRVKPPIQSQWLLGFLGALAVSLIIILLAFITYQRRERSSKKHRIDDLVQKNHPKDWDDISHMSIDADWETVKHLAGHITGGVLDGKLNSTEQ